MATRTIADGGGNWSSTGTWVEGVVPVLGDAVVATATSGQLTVDITTAACTSIDFTNYTNTFTISSGQQLAVSGTVKFVAGMTSAGTGTLRVLATSTLTSGGITFAGTLSLGGTSQTYTLGDAWIVSGGLIFSGTTAVSLTGTFNISVAGGLTMTTTSTGTVSATIILNGTGTWSGTAALRNNLTINTAGTITVSGNVRYDTGTLTYTAGTVTTTGSTLIVATTATLNTNGISWNNVTLSGNGTNITLTSDMLVTKLLTLGTSTATFNINGAFTITCDNSAGSGGITFSGTTSQTNGTASIKMTGGTYTGVSSCRLGLNLELDGNITISSAAAMIYQAGILKYTSGTITVTGTTLSLFNGGTLDTSGMTWNNVSFIGTSQTYNLSSDLNLSGNLSLSGVTTTTINGLFNINVSGNLTVTTTATNSGTASIVLNGTGTWSHSAAGVIRNNLTINSPSGTITVSGTVYYNTGTITYTAGVVNTSGSTLNIGTSTTLNTNGITWYNVTIPASCTITMSSDFTISNTADFRIPAGTLTFTSSTGSLVVNGNLYIGSNSYSSAATTYNLSNDLNVQSLYLQHQSNSNAGLPATASFTINNNTINVYGNLSLTFFDLVANCPPGQTVGTTNIILKGTGTWSHTLSSTNKPLMLNLNLTIDTVGTITIGSTVYKVGSLTYTSGNVDTTTNNSTLNCQGGVTFNCSGMNGVTTNKWNNIILTGISQTFTLLSDLYLSGNLTLSGATATTLTLTSNIIYVGGNLTQNTTATTSGTTTIVLNGTGIWSNSSTGVLRNNLTINTAGTITVSGTVYYNTGTITYTAGTVVTTGSTLNIGASTTLNTNGITWNNLSVIAASTITLGSNLKVLTTFSTGGGGAGFATTITPGAFSVDFSTANVNIGIASTTNMSFTYNGTITCNNFQAVAGNTYTTTLNGTTFNVNGNFTLTTYGAGGGSLTGTSSFNLVGTGTVQEITSANNIPITNNITINTSGTITFASGTALPYQTGTLTYTAGTVITTNFTLYCTNACTLNTSGISWSAVTLGGPSQTFTLSSDLNVTNLVLVGTTSSIINGNTINVSGNLTISSTAAMSGTTNVIMNGTGTVNTGSASIANNLTINTLGTITITALQYRTNTLTYIAGTIAANSSLIISGSCTINTSGISWGSLTISATSTITLSSNFTVLNTVSISGSVALTITPSGNNIDFSTTNMSLGSNASLTCNGTITCNNLQLTAGNTYNQTLNGTTLNIGGNLTVVSAGAGGGSVIGTSTLVLIGTGTISASSAIPVNVSITINSTGTITLQGTLVYQVGTFRYISGKVITKNSTFYLSSACTLINCHRIPFNIVTITSGVTITMNEFFTGAPGKKTTIQPSSTTNYTITFQDNFEKFARNVKISRATLSRPNQLTVITDKGNNGNNVGIKFYSNQMPNGFAKNNPSVQPQSTYLPGGLVTDPCFV